MSTLDDLPLRTSLRGKHAYGAPMIDVPVTLNVNENTHPIPVEVADDIARSIASVIAGVNRYPDRDFIELRDSFAGYLGPQISAEQVWAANGSNEVLQQILQAFGGPGRSVLGFEPSYSMHSILASGTDTEYISGHRGPDYELSAHDAVAQIEQNRPDLVFVATPNNPTGTPTSNAVIEAIYDATPGMVVVDAAYAEFQAPGSDDVLDLLPGRPRLIVTRTMSKAFAFAGVRVGYLVADPAVIEALMLVRLPYHLSTLTQTAALAALRHAPTMLRMVAEIRDQRMRMELELPELGIETYRSDANFSLIHGSFDSSVIWQRLLDRGVLVRDVGIPNTLRVTAGTAQETTTFLSALRESLAQ